MKRKILLLIILLNLFNSLNAEILLQNVDRTLVATWNKLQALRWNDKLYAGAAFFSFEKNEFYNKNLSSKELRQKIFHIIDSYENNRITTKREFIILLSTIVVGICLYEFYKSKRQKNHTPSVD